MPELVGIDTSKNQLIIRDPDPSPDFLGDVRDIMVSLGLEDWEFDDWYLETDSTDIYIFELIPFSTLLPGEPSEKRTAKNSLKSFFKQTA